MTFFSGWFKLIFQRRSGVAVVSQTTLANISIQAANLLCGFVSARVLGPGGRGEMAAIILWPQFFAYLLTLGIPVASIYYTKRHPHLSREFSAIALVVSLIMGVLGAIAGFFIIPFSLHTYSPQVVHWAQIVVLTTPLALCSLTLTIQVLSAESFGRYNLFRALPPVLTLIVLSTQAWSGHLNSFSGALTYILAGLPILIWNLIWVWRNLRPRFTKSREPARLLFGYGMRVWGSDLLSTVANQVDRVLVVTILTPADVGLYVVAQSAAGVLNVVPSSIRAVILPKASDRSTEEIVWMVGRAARITAAMMFLGGLPLCFFGKFAVTLVFGSKFATAYIALILLTAEGVLDGTTGVLTQAFLAAGCPGTVTILQVCGLFLAIPLLALLAPRWGLNGAAAAMLISTSMRLLFVSMTFRIRLKMPSPSLLLTRRDLSFRHSREDEPAMLVP